MKSEFRRAHSADHATIAALERACFGARDGAFNPRQLRALLANPKAHWLIRNDGLAVACWLACNNGRARWARLYSLAVHPHLRGQGVGARLLKAGFVWMRGQRLTVCRAEVKADNVAARRLYAQAGFSEVATLKDYYARGGQGVRLYYAASGGGSRAA